MQMLQRVAAVTPLQQQQIQFQGVLFAIVKAAPNCPTLMWRNLKVAGLLGCRRSV